MKRTIVSMPGDGIGKTVLPESIRVLEAVGFDAEYVHGDVRDRGTFQTKPLFALALVNLRSEEDGNFIFNLFDRSLQIFIRGFVITHGTVLSQRPVLNL